MIIKCARGLSILFVYYYIVALVLAYLAIDKLRVITEQLWNGRKSETASFA